MTTSKKREKVETLHTDASISETKRVGKLVRAAAVAVALGVEAAPVVAAPEPPTPVVVRRPTAAATTARTPSSGRKATAPRSMAAALLGLEALPIPMAASEQDDSTHFPLVVQPVLPKTEIDTLDQVRVAVFDENGQRMLHALVHGRCKLGPLPAGKYTVEIATRGHEGLHQVKLGPGSAGVVKYELEAA